jgi:hypothetical protein
MVQSQCWANSLQDPILKKPFTKKRTGGVVQGQALRSNPSTAKKTKTKTKKTPFGRGVSAKISEGN